MAKDASIERKKLKDAKRIVIKIGTSSLVYENGSANLRRIGVLVRVICDLVNREKEVVLVTSGAIGIGKSVLNLEKRPSTVEEKQAVAAVGQSVLMHIYNQLFSEYGHTAAQLLLTRDVTEDPASKVHVEHTFEKLLSMGIVPIVNENDSVAVEEIKFGDNDNLSYVVAGLVKAELLIILTDTDGYYDKNPSKPGAELYHNITDLSEEIERAAGASESGKGTGGMLTKVHACRLAADEGINAVICNGEDPEVIFKVIDGDEVGTMFVRKNIAG